MEKNGLLGEDRGQEEERELKEPLDGEALRLVDDGSAANSLARHKKIRDNLIQSSVGNNEALIRPRNGPTGSS